ncbi:CotH kinase family protein [bacterium]|nr:CotH kinase family protein [bacterium]
MSIQKERKMHFKSPRFFLNLKQTVLFSILILSLPLHGQWWPPRDPEGTVDFKSSNLPIILIDTDGRRIEDEPRITVDMAIIDNGPGKRNQVTDHPGAYQGKIAIEQRGTSSSSYPKKQYRFETQDSLGENLNVSLLGLPRENDWILNAPYNDESLIRNALAYRISNAIGRYAARTRFCELVLNGDYRGLYILMEKIKRDKNRIDIAEMDADDTAGDSLTGGYIIKIDRADQDDFSWRSAKRQPYVCEYPKADDITTEQKNYIKGFIDRFEQAMSEDWTADPRPEFLDIIDLDAFVDHFIVNEFTKNIDAYRLSAFLFKDRDSRGGRLVAGPVWDMNLSMANAFYEEDFDLVEGWEVDHRLRKPWDGDFLPFWWEKLGHDPVFETPAKARWQDLRGKTLHRDSVFAVIDEMVAYTAEARVRNFEKWPGVLDGASYESKIERLKNWITARLAWIDANIGSLSSSSPSVEDAPVAGDFFLYPGRPNPFNAATVIAYRLPSGGRVTASVYDATGRRIRVLFDQYQQAGIQVVVWDGTDDEHRQAATGTYLIRIRTGNRSATGKLLLLR